MGQEVSSYIEHIGHFTINHINHKKDVAKLEVIGSKDEDEDEDEEQLEKGECKVEKGECKVEIRTCPYIHYRTSIGSPAITRRSFTEAEIEKFKRENDGFPLPCSDEELKAFDKDVFLEQTAIYTEQESPPSTKKSDRQRSKSTTAIPDHIKSKFLRLHISAPAKPKFLEQLINRVISKRGRSLQNGLTSGEDEAQSESAVEQLSPDTEKRLVEAESIVQELLSTCAPRPASGDSTDSGKGSLLGTTSDFSPTLKRVSWSTPNSPTFHGIVRQRLRNFQALLECREMGEEGPSTSSPPSSPKAFQRSDSASSSQSDRAMIGEVMSRGYVKSLVQMINHQSLVDKKQPADKQADSAENSSPSSENWAQTHSSEYNRLPSHSFEGDSQDDLCTVTNGATTDHNESKNEGDCLNCSTSPVAARNNSSPSKVSTSSQSKSHTESHEEEEEPKDKLQWIAEEILSTEKIYVSRLHLLDQIFYFRLTLANKQEKFIPQEILDQIFSKIKPIYDFHKDFLLPNLEERINHWSTNPKIGDLMCKFAPFFKLSSEYVKGFDNAMELINVWTSRSPKFAAHIQEIQQEPECGQLSLQHHMLEPIQRVPRYELFMKDYLKHLSHDSSDKQDAQMAQQKVTSAASHSNSVLKKIEKFHKLLVIIQNLNGDGLEDLVIPTRELIKEGRITKISARSGEKQDRYLFLFNDLLLVCNQTLGSYKVRARLSVDGMEVLPGDNLTHQNTFCIKSTEKVVEFMDDCNSGVGLDWLASFEQVIAEYKSKPKVNKQLSNADEQDSAKPEESEMNPDMIGVVSPTWIKDWMVTMCMQCTVEFTAIKRKHHCRGCGRVFCQKCSSYKAALKYKNNDICRVCETCYQILTKKNGNGSPEKKSNQLAACDPALLSGYLASFDNKRGWVKRWIAVRSDFAMYVYKKHQDVKTCEVRPLPGYEVSVSAKSDKIDRNNVFKLVHKMGNYFFQADSEDSLKQWVRVLEKLVKLEQPNDEDLIEDKRNSAHSVESSHSSSSEQS